MPIKSILLDVHGRPPPSGLLTLTPEPQNSRITPKERAPQGFLACLVVSLGGHFHASADGTDQRSARDLLRASQSARASSSGRGADLGQWQSETGVAEEIAWHQSGRPSERACQAGADQVRPAPCQSRGAA